MTKILFVDHIYHKKTKSSQFFLDLLETRFDVETYYVDPGEGWADDVALPEDVDVVVLWQADYLAPLFLNIGVPTIVVPMYDGSANMPSAHWRIAREARYISFSFHLHEMIRRAGGESLLVKYFPPVPEKSVTDFSRMDAFLWQRSPQNKIHWKFVNDVIGHQLTSLHIHDAPDSPFLDRASYAVDRDVPYPITVSTWFDNRADLAVVQDECNVFIAPRLSEGIGMAFLEAMARGCCVLANDLPTHNEYIMNWVNGILFNPNSSGHFTIDDPAQMGRWARRTAVSGRARWTEQHCVAILDFIHSAKAPTRAVGQFTSDVVSRLIDSYTGSFEQYTLFLSASEDLIDEVAGEKTNARGRLRADVTNRILDLTNQKPGTELMSVGIDPTGGAGLWTTSQTAEFHVSIAHGTEPCLLILDVSVPNGSPRAMAVKLKIGGVHIGRFEIAGGRVTRLRCPIPIEARKGSTLRVAMTTDFLVSGKDGSRGINLTAIGVFDADNVPVREVAAMEGQVGTFISEPTRRRDYVLWCLETGLPIASEQTMAAFDSGLVDQFSVARMLQSFSGRDPQQSETIWGMRSTRDGGVLGKVPFHFLMEQVLEKRQDVAEACDIESPQGLAAFLAWYYLIGLREMKLLHLVHDKEREWLQGVCLPTFDDTSPGVRRLVYCLWAFRGDVRAAFSLDTPEGRAGLVRWAYTSGVAEFDMLKEYLKPVSNPQTGSSQEATSSVDTAMAKEVFESIGATRNAKRSS